ncbi:MAG TPA: pentapeptide repeat-containing protein [Acidimicrobiales bacterium]|nr:pentapeptide repeat-containing protein [Acidimicrobiales bacterium]
MDLTLRDSGRCIALVLIGAVMLLVAGTSAAQAQPIGVAASDVVAQVVAGGVVELRDAVVHGDLVLPRSIRVNTPIRCRSCHFTGSIRAPEAVFGRGLDLEGATVDGGLDLSGASFDDWVNLDGTKVAGAALLTGVRLQEALSARDARFGGTFGLERARAKGPVSFARATFADTARFTGSEFGARADFAQTRYGEGVRFDDVVFVNSPTFSLADFGPEASFEGAEFRGGGGFQFAHFGDLTLERAVAAATLAFDEAVVDGEATLDRLTSSGKLSLEGIRARPGSLFVEQLAVEDLTMDVDLVPAIKGRAAQKQMLHRLEVTAKARNDLSTANDARFHRLSMKGEEKDGYARGIDYGIRLFAGYLVRPVNPLVTFAGLLAAGSLVRFAVKTYPGRRARKAAASGGKQAGPTAPAQEPVTLRTGDGGGGRIADLGKGVTGAWRTFSKGAVNAFESIAASLGVAFRLHPRIRNIDDGRIQSYGIAFLNWVEALAYKIMLAVLLLTMGNANETVRELLESVRP